MKRILLVILTVCILQINSQGQDILKPSGKEIFLQKRCQTCHSIESENIFSKKKDAKDLSTVGTINDSLVITSYLNKELLVNDKYHPIKVNLSQEDMDILVKWLLTLKGDIKL